MTTTASFARALGAYEMANQAAGHLITSDANIDRRLHEAGEAVISTRSTDKGGILWKLGQIEEHAEDYRETHPRLLDDIRTIQREVIEPDADLGHVASAAAVLAHRWSREDGSDFYIRLLRSAGQDAAALAR